MDSWTEQELALAEIVCDPEIQIREALDETTVERYRECLDSLPPAEVFDTEEGPLLSDGFHRIEAHRREGSLIVRVRMKPGARAEALAWAVVANCRHGKPLTRGELGAGIARLAEQPERWPTNAAIGRELGCSEAYVRQVLQAERVAREIEVTSTLGTQTRVELARIEEPGLQRVAAETAVAQGWTRDEVIEAKRVLNDEDVPRPLREAVARGEIEPQQITEPAVEFADLREEIVADWHRREEGRAAGRAMMNLHVRLVSTIWPAAHDPDTIVQQLSQEDIDALWRDIPKHVERLEAVREAIARARRPMEVVR